MTDHSQLIESGYRLALWIAAKWARVRPDLAEELRQEALTALSLAAEQFDPEHPNAIWPGLLAIRVRWALWSYVTKEYKRRQRFPEAAPTVLDDDKEVQAFDMLSVEPDPRHDPARESVAAVTRAALAALPPRDRRVLTDRYLAGDGCTLAAAGDTLGVTRERVRQIEAKAFERLRGVLE